jgi:isochorismate pyruvate lyase
MIKCNSLEEVRDEIDKLDDQLVSLISKRSHLIRQAESFNNSVVEVKGY